MISVLVEGKIEAKDGHIEVVPITVSGDSFAEINECHVPRLIADLKTLYPDKENVGRFVDLAIVHFPDASMPAPTTPCNHSAIG